MNIVNISKMLMILLEEVKSSVELENAEKENLLKYLQTALNILTVDAKRQKGSRNSEETTIIDQKVSEANVIVDKDKILQPMKDYKNKLEAVNEHNKRLVNEIKRETDMELLEIYSNSVSNMGQNNSSVLPVGSLSN